MTALRLPAGDDNRRSRIRVRTQMDCWYRTAASQTFKRTRLCDLSETGAGLYASGLAAEGARIDLTLRLGNGRYVSLSARPVWQRPCAAGALMGLQFEGARPLAVRKWLAGKAAMKVQERLNVVVK